jgi:hypothetical protein
LLLVCGVGYLVAYYATQGFADAGALSRLGYTNILIALSLLLLGLLLAVVGALLLLVKGRATAR